jgi:hypothetical protein
MPGYEVAGAPAGWDREVDMLDGTHYRLQYLQPLENLDPVAQVEAVGRRISLIVATDSDGRTQTLGSSYPGHPASVAGVAATVFETAPPPGGRHGVFWRANGFVFELYAYMDEAPLLRLAATVRPTGRPIAR